MTAAQCIMEYIFHFKYKCNPIAPVYNTKQYFNSYHKLYLTKMAVSNTALNTYNWLDAWLLSVWSAGWSTAGTSIIIIIIIIDI